MNYLKIFENIDDANSFLVCNSSNLRKLIQLKSNYEMLNNKLYQFKIITIDELINFLTFSNSNEVFLKMKENKISKNVGQEILKFSKYNFANLNKDLTKHFKEYQSLLNFHGDFLTNLNKYHFYSFENIIYLKPFIDRYQLNFEKIEIKSNNTPLVYKFKTLEEEVIFLFNEIAKLLDDGINPSSIYICGIDDNYLNTINKVSKAFNIKIDLANQERLGEIPYIKKILENDYLDLLNLLTDLEKLHNEYKLYRDIDQNTFDQNINKIINVFNKYPLNKYSEDLTYSLIKEDIINTKSYKKALTNVIKIIEIEQVITTTNEDFVFLINTTYGSFPKLLNDNEYLTDKEKAEINYPTTSLVNESNNNHLKKLIKLPQIKYLSYPLRDYYNEYQASDIAASASLKKIDKNLNLDEIKTIYAPKLIKDYFSSHDSLGKLLTTFIGDFKLTKNEQEEVSKYLKSKNFKLTPSSVARYFQVPFIYYLERVLKINNFKPMVSTLIGNFFHQMAEITMYVLFEEKIKKHDKFHNDLEINKIVINFIIEAQRKSFTIEEIFEDYLTIYTNLFLRDEPETLVIETKFFINKNKVMLIGALETLISFENSYPSKEINLELRVGNEIIIGNADLVKIYPDDSFTVIDYKRGNKSAFEYEKTSNLVNDLLQEKFLNNLDDLEFLQLLIYAMLLREEYKNLSFNSIGYFSYLLKNSKINALQSKSLDKTFYTSGASDKRIIENEEDLYKRLKELLEKTREKILNAEFPITVLRQLDNKKNLEKGWFSQYQALAFFNKNENEDEEENYDKD